MAGDDLNLTQAQKDDLMGKLMRDMQRAAMLGLIPAEGAKISARGEFIIEPSNIEADEDKKMRGYRHKDYGKSGKMLHGWPEGAEEPVALVVYNAIEEERAVAAGWSVTPLHGPAGRLDAIEEPEVEAVIAAPRTFAPPGAKQPFDDPSEVKTPKADKPKTKGRAARKATH
jgi:hypothetical protein